jgi:hypothetical protein
MGMKSQSSSERPVYPLMVLAAAMLWLGGCVMVGPSYVRPPAPTADAWIETRDPAITRATPDVSAWWAVFNEGTSYRTCMTSAEHYWSPVL